MTVAAFKLCVQYSVQIFILYYLKKSLMKQVLYYVDCREVCNLERNFYKHARQWVT